MDGKLGTFFMGVIAAVVLFLLWKKDRGINVISLPGPAPRPLPQPSGTSACAGCGPSSVGAPSAQGAMAPHGLDGMISPTTAPLNSVTGGQGDTSFYYNGSGITPDIAFTFLRVSAPAANPIASPKWSGGVIPNTYGSASTPSNITPVRATQAVPQYDELGFVQHWRDLGVGLTLNQFPSRQT